MIAHIAIGIGYRALAHVVLDSTISTLQLKLLLAIRSYGRDRLEVRCEEFSTAPQLVNIITDLTIWEGDNKPISMQCPAYLPDLVALAAHIVHDRMLKPTAEHAIETRSRAQC